MGGWVCDCGRQEQEHRRWPPPHTGPCLATARQYTVGQYKTPPRPVPEYLLHALPNSDYTDGSPRIDFKAIWNFYGSAKHAEEQVRYTIHSVIFYITYLFFFFSPFRCTSTPPRVSPEYIAG